MKPRFTPLVILALLAVAVLLTAAVVPSSFVFPTRQAVQTLTGSRALVSNSSGLLTNSTVTTTELAYVSGVTSAIQTQIDSKPASTNTALLNGTNTFTGTNNFTGTVLITNAASTISGNGAGLTNISLAGNSIAVRNLYAQTTNILISSSAVSATPLTNNGDYSSTSGLLKYTMPALLGSNSSVAIFTEIIKTSAQPANISICYYVGTNTNSVFYTTTLANTSAGVSASAHPTFLFNNSHSFTSQLAFASASWGGGISDARNMYPSNYVDTSIPWTLYIGIWSTVAATNISIPILTVDEYYRP